MSYSEKLRSPKWQRKRLHIFSRDNWRCVRCGNGDSQLHVHHRYYLKDKEVYQYPDSALETLCDSCHSKEHQYDNTKKIFDSVKHKHAEDGIEKLAMLFLKYMNDEEYKNRVNAIYNRFINHNNRNAA